MMQQGLMQEITALFPFKHLNALNTVGYKELFEVIEEKYTLEKAVALIKQNTRRYAKRQLTWLRAMKDVTPLDCLRSDLQEVVIARIGQFLEQGLRQP